MFESVRAYRWNEQEVSRDTAEEFAGRLPSLAARETGRLWRMSETFFGAFLARYGGLRLGRGFEYYHNPIRVGGERDIWLSYVWAEFVPRAVLEKGTWLAVPGQQVIISAAGGPCAVSAPGVSLDLRKGQMAVLAGGKQYRIRADPANPPFWMIFVTNCDFGPLRAKVFNPGSQVRILLRSIIRGVATEPDFNRNVESKLKIMELILSLGRSGAPPLARTVSAEVLPLRDQVERARAWITANASRRITLPEMARAAGTNIFTFSRRFRAETGVSPAAFHRELRLEEAKRLIAETRLPVKEVARRLDFPDQKLFGHAFKRNTGLSPRGYRTRFSRAKK